MNILESRKKLPILENPDRKIEAEGGCGVIGLASTFPVEGRHLLTSCSQMRNRGNGKGGGICAVGLDAEALGVSREILENDTLLQIAYLEPSSRKEIEEKFISPYFEVHHQKDWPTLKDHRDVPELELRPPDVTQYFVKVRPEALKQSGLPEEEFIYQNTYKLNHAAYASLGEKKAFVLSHGKNMMVLKIVGFAEDVIQYYKLENFKAHVWIGHQRYPTKGRVWHPGGAHPFIGLNEALVHNGDFANYSRVAKYLRQKNIHPLFLTDTEVAVLLFDLWSRVYQYPLEYVIEAMAPTTERDFCMLSPEKQKIYHAIQTASIKGSPDGPWFFIIAKSSPEDGKFQLIGVTDTSMLRPQVFALQTRGGHKIGFIASEKQAIDSCLENLEKAGTPFAYPADLYWNARGGSYSDGGAFIFELDPSKGPIRLTVKDKFGKEVSAEKPDAKIIQNHQRTQKLLKEISQKAQGMLSWEKREALQPPKNPQELLGVDARGFHLEGPESLSLWLVRAYHLGWKNIAAYNVSGHRFLGCGFGPDAQAKLEIYGSPGDYLGSGMDGLEMQVFNNAQDQAGQILKSGKLVIYGDVGQTFMYAAKGGEVYVLGNAAGRPLINAVGKPRVVINGTCLDYLAESFMAGDPLKGGGFVLLNAMKMDPEGRWVELETPYPGGNLFSLASGGAIYIRDPEKKVGFDQLNGGHFVDWTILDWDLIEPYLKENERLFGLSVETILTHRGEKLPPARIYRKVAPSKVRALIAHD